MWFDKLILYAKHVYYQTVYYLQARTQGGGRGGRTTPHPRPPYIYCVPPAHRFHKYKLRLLYFRMQKLTPYSIKFIKKKPSCQSTLSKRSGGNSTPMSTMHMPMLIMPMSTMHMPMLIMNPIVHNVYVYVGPTQTQRPFNPHGDDVTSVHRWRHKRILP